MRHPSKAGKASKARFNERDIEHAVDLAALAPTTEIVIAASRSSAVRVRRRAQLGPVLTDPTVAAVKRVGNMRILGTDPDALGKLEMKLASLLSIRENMERTNDFLQNHDRAGLLRYGYSAEGVEELFLTGPGQTPGFSAQELANMALSIERVRDRIELLGTSLKTPGKVEANTEFTYSEDPGEQRVSFSFPRKPALSVRQLLGQSGFRWSVTRGAWTRPLTANGLQAGAEVKDALAAFSTVLDSVAKITLH